MNSNGTDFELFHAGRLVARRLKASGIDTVFTLSGGHLFSIYDGCRSEDFRLGFGNVFRPETQLIVADRTRPDRQRPWPIAGDAQKVPDRLARPNPGSG
jgi:hypothetical protein